MDLCVTRGSTVFAVSSARCAFYYQADITGVVAGRGSTGSSRQRAGRWLALGNGRHIHIQLGTFNEQHPANAGSNGTLLYTFTHGLTATPLGVYCGADPRRQASGPAVGSVPCRAWQISPRRTWRHQTNRASCC